MQASLTETEPFMTKAEPATPVLADQADSTPVTPPEWLAHDGGVDAPAPIRARLMGTILIAGLNNAPLAGARLVMPMIALSLGVATPMIGVMAALFSLAPMIFNVGFGRWVDRAGTRTPILFSTSLILLACLMFEIARHPVILLPVAALIGAGAMFSHVAATRAVGELGGPDVRARNLGFLVVSYALFQFLGPMAAGYALGGYGPSAAFAVLGGFALLTCAVLAGRIHNFNSAPRESRPTTSPGRTVELLKLPALMRWLVIIGVFGGVQSIYPFIVSLHAVEIGLTAAQAGSLLGAFAIGSLTSRASVGLVTRLLPGQRVVFLALLIGGLAYAAIPFLHHFRPLLALSLALGFAIGIGAPIALALIYDAAPPNRINESIGLGMAITNFLQTFLPLSLGMAASGFGVSAMIWALSASMLIAAVAAMGRSKALEMKDSR